MNWTKRPIDFIEDSHGKIKASDHKVLISFDVFLSKRPAVAPGWRSAWPIPALV
jgi:hypothetical protein